MSFTTWPWALSWRKDRFDAFHQSSSIYASRMVRIPQTAFTLWGSYVSVNSRLGLIDPPPSAGRHLEWYMSQMGHLDAISSRRYGRWWHFDRKNTYDLNALWSNLPLGPSRPSGAKMDLKMIRNGPQMDPKLDPNGPPNEPYYYKYHEYWALQISRVWFPEFGFLSLVSWGWFPEFSSWV